MNLTHLDDKDRPKMVDVSQKDDTKRVAVASGIITMSKEAFEMVVSQKAKKRPCASNCSYWGNFGSKANSASYSNVPSIAFNIN